MRPWSLILLLLGCASCTVRVPQPRGIAVSLNATVRTDVRVEAPKPPAPAVALQGAPVVEFFGIPLEGSPDVVFVLDCSGSMTEQAIGPIAQLGRPGEPGGAPVVPSKIEVAREELVNAIQRLPAGTQVNVIFFNTSIEAFAPSMVPLEDSGRDGLVGFVRTIEATGRTALVPAMRAAFLMNPRRIMLLSDGLGNVGGDEQSLLRDAREAIRGGVRIDTIGLGRKQALVLQALAGESGGIHQAL